jgi:ribosomal protein L34
MHLALPTSPAHVAVSSDIMKKSFSATCWARMSRLEKAKFCKWPNMPSKGAMSGKPVVPRSTFSPSNRHQKCHFREREDGRDGHLVSPSRRARERVPARRL